MKSFRFDCIVRQEKDGMLRYLDIQIKARSEDAKNPGTFSAMEIRHPRKNFFFIFYSEQADTYWIVPSLELVKVANQNKSGNNKGKYRVMFTNANKNGASPRPKFREYENAFHLLDWQCESNVVANSDLSTVLNRPNSE